MPVVIDPADYGTWLCETGADLDALAALLRPCPAERMTAWPVSTRVNNARVDEAGLIEALPANPA